MAMNEQPGKYVEVEPGVELYYEDLGTGNPIIFIPGWTFSTELFTQQMAYFSKSHRSIVFDPRSHGRSTVTLHGNNYATHGADLAKLIEALDLKDVVLVGWSFGCLAQWEYVKLAGLENLKGMVCIDLSPKCLSVNEDDWTEGPLDEIGGAYNAFLQSPEGQRDFVAGYATEVMVQRELSKQELFWIVEQSLKTPYYIAAALFASGMFADNMAEAKLVDQSRPLLYIIAEHWSETAVPFTQKHLPNASIEVLGGHMMFWEHPEKFNKLVENFLSTLNST